LKITYLIIALDITGIKVTNRGQWMREKWGIKTKGYLKIHIVINIKSKKILSIKVMDEHMFMIARRYLNYLMKL